MKFITIFCSSIFFILIVITTSVVYAESFTNCFNDEKNTTQISVAAIKPNIIKQIPKKSTEYKLFDKICSINDNNKKIKRNDLILVDVRSKKQYQQFRINNSINLSLSLVKSKNYWQNNLLILINDGTSIRNLIEECGQLRKKGFKKVFVYKSGIGSWARSQGNIVGQYSNKDLSGIQAKELFAERDEYNWQLIDAINKNNFKKSLILKRYFPNIKKYSHYNKSKQELSKFQNIRYIFVDNSGDKIDLFNKLKLSNLFYLRGGVASFVEYIKTQYKITNKKEFTLQKPRSCK
ncbi:hypothetical protein MNBD_GAMMA22-1211 [hydrothermal vent metagenome]|uniref:Rhodanese domain-containing protein n=1 Tax=hydrothermal vent metagenome TaxID=652676 RepID=A0A3B0ZTC4_9ZZZZ